MQINKLFNNNKTILEAVSINNKIIYNNEGHINKCIRILIKK